MGFKTTGPDDDQRVVTLFDAAGNVIAPSNRLPVEGLFPPGSSIIIGTGFPSNPTLLRREYVKNGSSSNLLVDGSTTPVVFTYDADSILDTRLFEIRFMFVLDGILLNGLTLGKGVIGATGIKIDLTAEGATAEVANIQINEDFLAFASNTSIFFENTSAIDTLAMGVMMGGAPVLKAGTADKLEVTIRDNMIDTKHKLFQCSVYGVKE